MECDTCAKQAHPGAAFHCATCARSAIYTLRVEHAATLLDKESLGKRVEAAITGTPGGSQDSITLGGMLVDTTEAAKTTNYDRTLAELDDSRERVNQISDKAAVLKRKVDEQRRRIADMKKDIARRKSDAESAKHGLAARETRRIDEIQSSIDRAQLRWDRDYHKTVHARMYLCREAADLAGLRKRKRRTEDGNVRYFYSVGGVELPDLRGLNSRCSCLNFVKRD